MITCTVSEMRPEAIEKLTSMGLMEHTVSSPWTRFDLVDP